MIDDTDSQVLGILKEDGRATVRTIAKRLNLPISTVHNRLLKLKREQVIRKFTVETDYERLGLPVLAMVSAGIDHGKLADRAHGLTELKRKLLAIPGVERIYILTGDVDMIVLVRVASIKELDYFLVGRLRNIPEIAKTTTQIVLEEE